MIRRSLACVCERKEQENRKKGKKGLGVEELCEGYPQVNASNPVGFPGIF